jgi:hypothetical protein
MPVMQLVVFVNLWIVMMGSPMDNGTSGCCEAVTKIGATYSEFLKQELAKGIVYCPTLEEDAKAAGVPVIDFDTSQLEAGDVIMYTEQHHVVIYSGEGTGFVGNSSSLNHIIEGSDYNQMGWDPPIYPIRIIKTSHLLKRIFKLILALYITLIYNIVVHESDWCGFTATSASVLLRLCIFYNTYMDMCVFFGTHRKIHNHLTFNENFITNKEISFA